MIHVTLIKSELNKTGGLEKYTWRLAQDFCEQGARVTLLTTGTKIAPFDHPLLNMITFPISRCLSVLQVLHFDKACIHYLKKYPCSIVLSLDRTSLQTHIRAGNGVHAQYLQHRRKQEGKLKAASFYLNPLHRTLLSLEKKAFENPKLKMLFTNSHMIRSEILNFYHINPEKIHVIHNGVEWKSLEENFDRWEARKAICLKQYGLCSSAFQFLFMGHNYERKGLEKLLDALCLLKDRPFQLSIVGKEKNISFYRQKADQLGLGKKVFFFGPSLDSISFYQMADALVIPSLYDPFANVTVESLAMGVFVVSSKTNGGHEILNSEIGEVIEDLDNPEMIAKALKVALSRPKSQTSAQNIRSKVKHLDFSNQLRQITNAVLDRI